MHPRNSILDGAFPRDKCIENDLLCYKTSPTCHVPIMQIKPQIHDNPKINITSPILQTTAKIMCLDPSFKGQALL